MQLLFDVINYYSAGIIIALAAIVLILLVLICIQISKLNKLRKRYDIFTGANKRPNHNLEMMLNEYSDDVKTIKENYSRILSTVQDLEENMKYCVQKVGVIRYNPFDEMGGNLCFAIAILDEKDNGVVINGIHGRNGSYTYAKPVELGVSAYVLSDEEQEAIEKAKSTAYVPDPDRVVRVIMPPKKYKARYPKRAQEAAEEAALEAAINEALDENEDIPSEDIENTEAEITADTEDITDNGNGEISVTDDIAEDKTSEVDNESVKSDEFMVYDDSLDTDIGELPEDENSSTVSVNFTSSSNNAKIKKDEIEDSNGKYKNTYAETDKDIDEDMDAANTYRHDADISDISIYTAKQNEQSFVEKEDIK